MTNRFEGKVCIVTGAGSGIGREIVLGLLAEGATVVANDIKEVGLEEFKDAANVHPVAGDTALPETADSLVGKALEVGGRVDVLVNNAGIGLPGPAEELSNERWQRCIDVNLTGYFFLAKAAGKVMIGQRSGTVLNVSSMAGLAGVPENIGYVASKHGVIGITRSLAVDWARYGIRVNALCPGLTETDLIRLAAGNDSADSCPAITDNSRSMLRPSTADTSNPPSRSGAVDPSLARIEHELGVQPLQDAGHVSQWPGTARSSASAGRSLVQVTERRMRGWLSHSMRAFTGRRSSRPPT